MQPYQLARLSLLIVQLCFIEKIWCFIVPLALVRQQTVRYSLRNLTITAKISVLVVHRMFHDINDAVLGALGVVLGGLLGCIRS